MSSLKGKEAESAKKTGKEGLLGGASGTYQFEGSFPSVWKERLSGN